MTDPQIERWGEEFASTSDRQVWELLAEFRDEVLRGAAAKICGYGDPADHWAANLIDPDKEAR